VDATHLTEFEVHAAVPQCVGVLVTLADEAQRHTRRLDSHPRRQASTDRVGQQVADLHREGAAQRGRVRLFHRTEQPAALFDELVNAALHGQHPRSRHHEARTVVECGTSFGVSTIYLAGAVRDNGGGRVVGTELQHDKAVAAQANFVEAGVSDLIDLRVGDALVTLAEVPGPVDLADDVDMEWGSDVHGPLLDYLGDPDNGYLSIKIPTGDGIQACVRLG
jgi:hypothetical protein